MSLFNFNIEQVKTCSERLTLKELLPGLGFSGRNDLNVCYYENQQICVIIHILSKEKLSKPCDIQILICFLYNKY